MAETLTAVVRIEVLERQVLSLRRQVQQQGEWIDTMSSPLIKRAWWWCLGYRWRRVGRWYAKTADLR